MTDKIFSAYKSAIESQGFKPCGRVKNLDNAKTGVVGKLGIGMECLDRDLWEFEPVLDEIRMLGIHTARIQSGWQKTEKEEGVYDFAWLDNIVNKLLANDIQPLLCLSYGNELYCENPDDFPNLQHGGVGHVPIVSEREKKAWTRYVDHITRHFADRVKYFEVWNEPDVITFFGNLENWIDPYFELVRISSEIIRKNAPNSAVVSCTARLDYGKILIDKGIASFVDIHSFHGYNAWPEMCLGEQRATLTRIKSKAPALRIWRGEAGFPSYNDPRSQGALSGRYVSEDMQAKFILRHLLCDMINEDVEKSFYFHAYDFEHFKKIVRYHYGVLRHDKPRRKPSYYALQLLAHVFDDKVTVRRDAEMSFVHKNKLAEGELPYEKLLGLRFHTFEKNGKAFFAYYSPEEITDTVFASSATLSLPFLASMKTPVIVDSLTRSIYPIENPERFTAPVTDYPMFIFDLNDISDISEMTEAVTSKADIIETRQAFEE